MIDWYIAEGLTPYQEKRGDRADVDAQMLTFEDIQRILSTITTFAEGHVVILRGEKLEIKTQKIIIYVKMYHYDYVDFGN